MEAGIKNEKSIVVTEDVTASKVGSGLLPVYATPSMIALMEGTCAESVQSELVEGEGTVGVSVDIKHIAATRLHESQMRKPFKGSQRQEACI